MLVSIENRMGAIDGSICGSRFAGGMAATLMNPVSALMNPLGSMVGLEQKEGLSDLKDLMREMIAALHQVSDRIAPVDMGGKDTRPGDLTAHFNPAKDQNINIYTGRGDDMVIIV